MVSLGILKYSYSILTMLNILSLSLAILGGLVALSVLVAPFVGLGVWLFAGWSGWWFVGSLFYDVAAGPVALGMLRGSQRIY